MSWINKGVKICEGLLKTEWELPHAGVCIYILSKLLHLKYYVISNGFKSDIDHAVELAKYAVDTLPVGHSGRANQRENLAFILTRRSKRLRGVNAIMEAHRIALEIISETSDADNT